MVLRAILAGALLSVDAWIAGAVYGREGIRAGWGTAAMVACLGAGTLAASMVLSGGLGLLIGTEVCRWLGAGLLMLLGAWTLLRGILGDSEEHRMQGRVGKIRFILELTVEQERADTDRSKTLSFREGLWLALAMSLDTVGAGLGLGMEGILPAVLSTFLFTLLALPFGGRLGRHLPKKHGWIGGACLMALGVLRLL